VDARKTLPCVHFIDVRHLGMLCVATSLLALAPHLAPHGGVSRAAPAGRRWAVPRMENDPVKAKIAAAKAARAAKLAEEAAAAPPAAGDAAAAAPEAAAATVMASTATPAAAIALPKSEAMPFMDRPEALDGSMPGDIGFDPLGFSTAFEPYYPLSYLREAEIKHGRVCMLAWLGYVSVDAGFRVRRHAAPRRQPPRSPVPRAGPPPRRLTTPRGHRRRRAPASSATSPRTPRTTRR
jgi:hypothetical protein